MKVDGQCFCGYLTFVAEVDPDAVHICHCTDCQTLSGSAFRVVVPAFPDTLRLLSGTPKFFVKTAASGRRRTQAFCPECGTPLYSEPVEGGAGYIRVGAVRQRSELVPRAQYWRRSALSWVDQAGELPKHHEE